MEPTALAPLLMLIPALVVSVTTALNAKKLNAQWRQRRAARAERVVTSGRRA